MWLSQKLGRKIKYRLLKKRSGRGSCIGRVNRKQHPRSHPDEVLNDWRSNPCCNPVNIQHLIITSQWGPDQIIVNCNLSATQEMLVATKPQIQSFNRHWLSRSKQLEMQNVTLFNQEKPSLFQKQMAAQQILAKQDTIQAFLLNGLCTSNPGHGRKCHPRFQDKIFFNTVYTALLVIHHHCFFLMG